MGSERCRHSLQITSIPNVVTIYCLISRHGVPRAAFAHCSVAYSGKQLAHIVERSTLSRRLWQFRCSCLSLIHPPQRIEAIEQVLLPTIRLSGGLGGPTAFLFSLLPLANLSCWKGLIHNKAFCNLE